MTWIVYNYNNKDWEVTDLHGCCFQLLTYGEAIKISDYLNKYATAGGQNLNMDYVIRKSIKGFPRKWGKDSVATLKSMYSHDVYCRQIIVQS